MCWLKTFRRFTWTTSRSTRKMIRWWANIQFACTATNGNRNGKVWRRRYQRPRFVGILNILTVQTNQEFHIQQIRTVYPAMHDTCNKLIAYLRTIARQQDVETGDVCSRFPKQSNFDNSDNHCLIPAAGHPIHDRECGEMWIQFGRKLFPDKWTIDLSEGPWRALQKYAVGHI